MTYSYDRTAAGTLPKGVEAFLSTAWKDAVEKIHPGSKPVYVSLDDKGPGPWAASGQFFVHAGAGDIYPRQAVKPDVRALKAAVATIAKAVESKFGVSLKTVGQPKVKHETFKMGFFLGLVETEARTAAESRSPKAEKALTEAKKLVNEATKQALEDSVEDYTEVKKHLDEAMKHLGQAQYALRH